MRNDENTHRKGTCKWLAFVDTEHKRMEDKKQSTKFLSLTAQVHNYNRSYAYYRIIKDCKNPGTHWNETVKKYVGR